MLALVNMSIWIKSHTLSSTHMQAFVFFHVCTHTLKSISDSCHLQERSDTRSGEESGTAESLSHVSLAQTITDNLKRVIQYTQRGKGCKSYRSHVSMFLFMNTFFFSIFSGVTEQFVCFILRAFED